METKGSNGGKYKSQKQSSVLGNIPNYSIIFHVVISVIFHVMISIIFHVMISIVFRNYEGKMTAAGYFVTYHSRNKTFKNW